MTTHLLLTSDFPPMGGGVARWTGELAKRYPAGRLIVSTGQQPGGADSDEDFPNRIERVPIPVKQLRSIQGILLWSRRVAVLTRAARVGFIWCANVKPSTYPAKWTHERTGTPFGIFVHGGDLLMLQHQVHQSPVKRRTAKALLGSAAVLVANSEWTRQLCVGVLRELGLELDDGRVRTVPLGTDPAFFRPGVDTAGVRARYGLGDGRWILSVARLVPHKGIDTVLQAMVHLTGSEADVGYAVVGSGEGLADLKRMVVELGLGGRVRFLTGVPDADLPALYNAAQVYVGVSRRTALSVEDFGISLAEAASCGVAVVAGRSGGVPEAVKNGETGLLVGCEEPVEVADAVRRLLRDRALAARLGAAGRAAIERYYNWDRVTKDLTTIAEEFAGVPV
jgi:phosphatidyl-myo-inositol dimannoside synthase